MQTKENRKGVSDLKDYYGMQFIMDGNGNYYKTNENNQLVVASDRDEASLFTLYDANQKIGGGKKAVFYFTIPANEIINKNKKEENKILEEDEEKNLESKKSNIKKFDWVEYLEQFCEITSLITGRCNELTNELSEVDQEICDVLHLIELYELTAEEEIKVAEMLKELRQRRRDIKDEAQCLECVKKSIGNSGNIAEAKTLIKQMKRMEHRIYRPRRLSDLFENMEGREINRGLYREYIKKVDDREMLLEVIEEPEMEEENEIEYVKQETVYDVKENDWYALAMEQLVFLQNIPQYMINLEIDIDFIDQKLEDTLIQIEDANYNVTQGYKAFKELKDLRNLRKNKQKELDALRIITDGINMEALADVFQNRVEEVEKIFGI